MSDTYGTNPLVRICRDFALAGERRDLSDGPAWIRTRDRRIMSRGERPDRRRSREIMQFLEPLPGLRLGRRVPVRLRRAGSHTGPRRRPAFPPSNVFRQMKCPRLDRQHRGPHRPGTLRVVDPALPRVLGMPKAVYGTRRRPSRRLRTRIGVAPLPESVNRLHRHGVEEVRSGRSSETRWTYVASVNAGE
jgi:hypothetical protein